MNILDLLRKLIIPIIAGIWSIASFGQSIDLSKLTVGKTITVHNRNATLVSGDSEKPRLHLDEKDGVGLAWLENVTFTSGTVEFDVKGRNVLQKSFVGIAFQGSNDSTYDAIYFRPFNFKSPEAERKNHSVQYISMPKFDWPKLRSEFPNQYEKPLNSPPNPDDWIHCRVDVQNEEVRVFVNREEKPSLVVNQLTKQKGNKLAFWVGHGSDGNFANLSIKSK